MPMMSRHETKWGEPYSKFSSSFKKFSPPSAREIHQGTITRRNAGLWPSYHAFITGNFLLESNKTRITTWPALNGENTLQRYPVWGAPPARLQEQVRADIILKIISTHESLPTATSPAEQAKLLDLILGPRITLAQSKALQAFLNPERQAFQVLCHVVLAYLEQSKITDEQEKKRLATTCFAEHPALKAMMQQNIHEFIEHFPPLKKTLNDFLSTFFRDCFMEDSPLYLLQTLIDKVAAFGFSIDEVSLAQMETQALTQESRHYAKTLREYLSRLSEGSPEKKLFQQITGKDRDEEIIQAMLALPAVLPITASPHFLPMLQTSETITAFVHHGAQVVDVNPTVFNDTTSQWSLLQQAILCFQPKSPQEALLTYDLHKYSEKTHAKDHGLAIALSLRDATQQEISLLDSLTVYTASSYFSRLTKGYLLTSRLKTLVERHTYAQNFMTMTHLLNTYAWAEWEPVTDEQTTLLPQALTHWKAFFATLPQGSSLQVQGDWFADNDNQTSAKLYGLAPYLTTVTHLSFKATQLNDEALFFVGKTTRLVTFLYRSHRITGFTRQSHHRPGT